LVIPSFRKTATSSSRFPLGRIPSCSNIWLIPSVHSFRSPPQPWRTNPSRPCIVRSSSFSICLIMLYYTPFLSDLLLSVMMDGIFQSFWHSLTLYTATHASPAIPAKRIPTAAVIPSIHPISLSPFVFSNPLLHPALCQDGCLLFCYIPAYNQNLPCFSYVHPLISCTSSPSGHFFLYGFCSSNKKRRIPPIMEVPSISYTNIFFLTQLH